MELFYTHDIQDDQAIFSKEESTHILKAKRKRPGDNIFFTDGMGMRYEGKIEELLIPKKSAGIKVDIVSKSVQEKSWKGHLTLAVAPTKNANRIETLVEKAVELGVDEICPIITEHSERRNLKSDRLHRIVISAAKQSLKYHFPILREVCSFSDFIRDRKSAGGTHFIPHCHDLPKDSWSTMLDHSDHVCIALGPEGDFSLNEVQLALKSGFVALTLGEQRLRTETAGIKCCVGFHLLQELK